MLATSDFAKQLILCGYTCLLSQFSWYLRFSPARTSSRVFIVSVTNFFTLVAGCLVAVCLPCIADDQTQTVSKSGENSASAGADPTLPGHSDHGEVFNEGPRQAAYLMQGMGNVVFQASTSHPLAQRFINQGVAQLHGFWYYEAERSFRQAAMHDPECAIAYWGMSMANSGNRTRARGFISEAVKRKSNASRREQLYIDAWDRNLKEEDDNKKKIEKKERAQRYTRDLEDLVVGFPDDIEAKAFLALQLWENERNDLPITSRLAIDAIIEDVFDANPMHPAHHYRIHLWDSSKPDRALRSAALGGPSLPGIAHMWHMPGHTYSKLQRYHDAVWQQEASARVDHAHMMRDHVLPDQIHNYAHNNEWLIRNLIKIGKVTDAITLAKNMIELPRHPKLNTLSKGSSSYGRQRLIQTLTTYRLWPELIALADTMYLEPTDDEQKQIERLRLLGVAHAFHKNTDVTEKIHQELTVWFKRVSDQLHEMEEQAKRDQASAEEAKKPHKPSSEKPLGEGEAKKSDVLATKLCDEGGPLTAADRKKAEVNRQRRQREREETSKKLKPLHEKLEKGIAAIDAVRSAEKQNWKEALEFADKAGEWDLLIKAEWLASAQKLEDSLKILDKEIKDKPSEILPLAVHVWVCQQNDKKDLATGSFDKLRTLASTAEITLPVLARLDDWAAKLGHEKHWAAKYERAKDIGQRPDLDTLGPFRWSPYVAADWELDSGAGGRVASKALRTKPQLLIFYLGFGCLHCMEQLQAFSPKVDEFRNHGIELQAISTEDLETLKTGMANYGKPLNIPLCADPALATFKSYRCFDDFEQKPLHGTFLIAPDGRVLWQDIGHEPFMDAEFVLKESQRLLRIHAAASAKP